MKRTINKEWHLAHPMPRNPSLEQRIEWHLMHAANCTCRDMPAGIRKELTARGLVEPTPRSLK
jgi:hypothetical protein